MFHVDMYADPVLSLALASEVFNHMIQFDTFRFLSGKEGAVPFLKKNLPKIPFKW